MNEDNYHILADIKLYETKNGGREGPTLANFFGCPLRFIDRNFDCRLMLKNFGSLFPGDEKKKIPVLFLDPEEALSFLRVGTEFKILEVGMIGEGKVVEIKGLTRSHF